MIRLALAWLAAMTPLVAMAQTTRPNVLVIVADDMSWESASLAGNPAVRTPALDRMAREGVWFRNAHTIAASCTPSRGALLTGRPIWQLEEGAVLHGTLPSRFAVYPELLESAGYAVGYAGKGWGPGDPLPGGRDRNPAGPKYPNSQRFLDDLPDDKPFCFWFGSVHPHRPYTRGHGTVDPAKVRVPPMLPDVPEVRDDLADYLREVEDFDGEVAILLSQLRQAGRLDNTLIIVTSDNGMPFPRGKATLYEYGTHMPLLIRWPGKITPGRTVDDFVSHIELAPTILEAVGLETPKEMVGKSLMAQLVSEQSGQVDPKRDRVFLGNERHANVRAGRDGYPRRAVRTKDFLYIWNIAPDRWPAGDPPRFGDVDPSAGKGGPTKDFILAHRAEPAYARFFEMSFDKRPPEELYDLKLDPTEQTNVASDPKYADAKKKLRDELEAYLKSTGDPRTGDAPAAFDSYPFRTGRGSGNPN